MAQKKSFNNSLFTAILLLVFFLFFSGICCMLHWGVGLGLFVFGLPFIVYYFVEGAKEAKIVEEGIVNYTLYKDCIKKGKKGDSGGYLKLFEQYFANYNRTKNEGSLKKANAFLDKALKLNNPDAYYHLADNQLRGIGTKINTEEGMKNLLIASKMGSLPAKKLLIRIYIGKTIVPNVDKMVDYNKAFAIAKEAASSENKDGEILFLYGLCWQNGYGVVANNSIAKTWFQAAINGGYSYAQINLNDILQKEARERERINVVNPNLNGTPSKTSELEDFFNSELSKK